LAVGNYLYGVPKATRPAVDEEEQSAMASAEANMQPIDWQAVLTQHDRWLRTVVLARVGERAAVDEVMQEVALAAVRQKAPIEDPAKVGSWLYRVAVMQSLLYRRKRGRGRKLVQRFADRLPADAREPRSTDPLAWLLDDERRGLVRQAIGRLKRRDAEILLLKYTEDWSYQQLADHLGISGSAVEARLHRARARMRQELQALQVEPVS
jgi:RNA polymerase sigma factor (sigma-70 family)